MFHSKIWLGGIAACLLAVFWLAMSLPLAAQSPASPTKATSPSGAAAAAPASEAARKAAILQSDCWRRAMFERDQWLRAQRVFPPEQVARIKADFAARVDGMSAAELELVLKDLEAKFEILDSPEAREARRWFGQYISVLAERRREEVLRQIPDIATMSSAQLDQVILDIQRKMDRNRSAQSSFERNRQATVDKRIESNRATRASQIKSRQGRSKGYRSPFRTPSFERAHENVDLGRDRGMLLDPNGNLFMTF